VNAVEQARSSFAHMRSNPEWFKEFTACNLWTSAFFFTYSSENANKAPISETLHNYLLNPSAAFGPMIGVRENVFLVNNLEAEIENTKFIFTTLWTNISIEKQWVVKQNMSDFHRINFKGEWFTTSHYNDLHKQSLSFLKEAIQQNKSEKIIVITHHTPTFYNYPEKYKGDALNEAFAVELFNFIEDSEINYWVFGHHHQNIPPFFIGKTELVNNQLGYVKYNENVNFRGDAIISI
jgi:hypothetical protein